MWWFSAAQLEQNEADILNRIRIILLDKKRLKVKSICCVTGRLQFNKNCSNEQIRCIILCNTNLHSSIHPNRRKFPKLSTTIKTAPPWTKTCRVALAQSIMQCLRMNALTARAFLTKHRSYDMRHVSLMRMHTTSVPSACECYTTTTTVLLRTPTRSPNAKPPAGSVRCPSNRTASTAPHSYSFALMFGWGGVKGGGAKGCCSIHNWSLVYVITHLTWCVWYAVCFADTLPLRQSGRVKCIKYIMSSRWVVTVFLMCVVCMCDYREVVRLKLAQQNCIARRCF